MSRFLLFFVATTCTLIATPICQGQAPTDKGAYSKIYSLAEFGHDADLCKWISDTIPTAIRPETWTSTTGTLSYYAPGKILVIYHTAAVHAQVEEFLHGLKKALPADSARLPSPPAMPAVVPAQYVPANVPPPAMPSPLAQSNGYPVPATAHVPKHLFHFVIRYEGEGLIDSNVVKFAKSLAEVNAANNNNNCVPPYVTPPPPPGATPTTLSGTSGFNPNGVSNRPRMPGADEIPPPPLLPPSLPPALPRTTAY